MRTKIKVSNIIILVLIFLMLSVSFVGCTAPGYQGWSGFGSVNGVLYLGTMEGKVVALNPLARSQGVTFPSKEQGEWSYTIKGQTASGAMCGLTGCAPNPSASKAIIYSTPVATKDLVYVGTYSNGRIYALNSVTGALRWVYPRESNESLGAIVGNLVLYDGAIYVGSSNGKVFSLDAATGDIKWEITTKERIWVTVSVKDGIVYAGSYDGKFYALSAKDGSQVWVKDLPVAMSSSPCVTEDSIFLGTFDSYLRALSKVDGNERWKFSGGSWFWAEPVVRGTVIYAACLDGKLYAIDSVTGTEVWRFDASSPIVSKPVLMEDNLTFITESGDLYILDFNGKNKQKVTIGQKVMSPIYVEKSIVYIHARDRAVYAVDIAAGTIKWKFNTGIE